MPNELLDFARGYALARGWRAVHMLRQPPAWALDLGAFEQAETAGAVLAEIRDPDDGCTFMASVSAFRNFGFHVDRGPTYRSGLPCGTGKWRTLASPGCHSTAEASRRQ